MFSNLSSTYTLIFFPIMLLLFALGMNLSLRLAATDDALSGIVIINLLLHLPSQRGSLVGKAAPGPVELREDEEANR
jgi:hypothetical protein